MGDTHFLAGLVFGAMGGTIFGLGAAAVLALIIWHQWRRNDPFKKSKRPNTKAE